MDFGVFILEMVGPLLESLAPIMPGDIFPYFFKVHFPAFYNFKSVHCDEHGPPQF